MTDTEITPLPATPAAVACAVLDAIEAQPDVFDMDNWARLHGATRLAPAQVPVCGSRLCAAGWAAHVAGWTLVSLPDEERTEVITKHDNGAEYMELASVHAERGEERRLIGDVAAEVLGLTPAETFWYVSAPVALTCLREIAGR